MLAKAKLESSITFIVLASFTIVTYDRQNMFIIQATGHVSVRYDMKETKYFLWMGFTGQHTPAINILKSILAKQRTPKCNMALGKLYQQVNTTDIELVWRIAQFSLRVLSIHLDHYVLKLKLVSVHKIDKYSLRLISIHLDW